MSGSRQEWEAQGISDLPCFALFPSSFRCHALHEETPTPALPTTTLATLVVTLTVVVAVAHHTV